MKLIGFPHAGERWNWTGHATVIHAERNTTGTGAGRGQFKQLGADTYALVAAGLMVGGGLQGDITGAAGSKLKRARAVGAGQDPDIKRADALAAWVQGQDHDGEQAAVVAAIVAGRAQVMADIATGRQIGQQILTLAGGAGWGDGRKFVTMQSGGMAARAARAMVSRSGRKDGHQPMPSDTSLQDAAGAAAVAMWFEWQCYSAMVGDIWNDNTIRHLASRGWRAAYNSLVKDQAEGKTGDRAGRDHDHGGAVVPIEAAQLDIERESLASWARDRQGRIFSSGDDGGAARIQRARRQVLRWFADVLDVRAKGRTGAAERARFSVLARLVHGRDIATASKAAGFASGRAAVESFRSGKVWERLRQAVASHKGQAERRLMAVRVRAVRAAMLARAEQGAARAGSGRSVKFGRVPSMVTMASGAAAMAIPEGVATVAAMVAGLARLTRPAGQRRGGKSDGVRGTGAIHPMARAWAQATERRGQAVAVAIAARRALQAMRAERIAAFHDASKGLRSGWLR